MSQHNPISEARIALLVEGEGLNMTEITTLLALQPTRTVHRGELLNRLPEIMATQDEWVYVLPLTSPMGTDTVLLELLDRLLAVKPAIDSLQKTCNVTLRLSVQSDYAQMVYVLTTQTLTKLNELALPLEVSSLSWGEVGI